MKHLVLFLAIISTLSAAYLGQDNVPSSRDEEDILKALSSIERKLSREQSKQWKQALEWHRDYCRRKGLIFWQTIRGQNSKDLVVLGYTLHVRHLREIAATKAAEEKEQLLREADFLSEEANSILAAGTKTRGNEAPTPSK